MLETADRHRMLQAMGVVPLALRAATPPPRCLIVAAAGERDAPAAEALLGRIRHTLGLAEDACPIVWAGSSVPLEPPPGTPCLVLGEVAVAMDEANRWLLPGATELLCGHAAKRSAWQAVCAVRQRLHAGA